MKIIKILLIIAMLLMCFGIASRNTARNKKRIETLEEDLHTIETKLRSQRLIASYQPFAIDIDKMETIQGKILRYLKLEYVETFAQKKLIKRRWR